MATTALALALLTVLPSRRTTGAGRRQRGSIFSAITAHREAWAAFQVAPDGEALSAGEAEHDAAMRLLRTACATRAGALALIAHLRWYLEEEGTNLPASGLGGCKRGDLVRVRLAELALFVPEASPPAVIALPAPRGSGLLLAAMRITGQPTSP